MTADLLSLPWRTGRKVGRTVYAQLGPETSDDDPLIGLMDTPELARAACEAHNRQRARERMARRGAVRDLAFADLLEDRSDEELRLPFVAEL